MFKKKVGRPTNKSIRRRKTIKTIGVFSIIGLFGFIMFNLNNYVKTDKLKADANGVTRTATFVNTNLDYLEAHKLTCIDSGNGCTITLPRYNKKGHFSSYWSSKALPSENLKGIKKEDEYFYPIGYKYTLKSDMTFYPNFNHIKYDENLNDIDQYGRNQGSNNTNVYRNIEVGRVEYLGNVIYEFEKGVPDTAINQFMSEVKLAQKKIPWEFVPTKVFIMTCETYQKQSAVYAITHNVDRTKKIASYYTIDLTYDNWGRNENYKDKIMTFGYIHEQGHAWDFYYENQTGKSVHAQTDVYKYFKNMLDNDRIPKYKTLSDNGANNEWFAGMMTNYYYRILNVDTKKSYYAISSDMTEKEKNDWKTIMNKYINKSKKLPYLKSSNTKINIYDSDDNVISNKTIVKNLCFENEISYSGVAKENMKYSISNNSFVIKKTNEMKLKLVPINKKINKNQKAILTIYDGKDKSKSTRVVYVNSENCGNYSIKNATVEQISDQTYTGGKITPQPVIKVGNNVLKKDVDYNLTYANNINVGIGKIKITGIGTYSGEKVVTFKIIKQATQQTGNNTSTNTQTTNNQQQNTTSTEPVKISTIKVTGIAPNNCRNKGVTFTIDSTRDNGASITNVEVSTDTNTWKKSNNCTIGSKKATCRITSVYNSIYYKVTTSHNHYQILGPYCTK